MIKIKDDTCRYVIDIHEPDGYWYSIKLKKRGELK